MRIRLDIPLLLSEITDCKEEKIIEYISTDTRELLQGDLFIPILGKNFNGRDFIKNAKDIGAFVLDTQEGASALLKVAALYKSKLAGLKYTVGITGSVGKTTAKEFIYKIASQKYDSHKTQANENNLIGVAKTILSAKGTTEVLILEIGTNHPGEIKEITSIISPDIALITNIGTSHIGNFGSRDAIKAEKLSIKSDEKALLFTRLEDGLSGFTFSARDKSADMYIEKNDTGICVYKSQAPYLKSECPFSEIHLIEELACALSVCSEMGIEKDLLIKGVSSLSYDITRQKTINLKKFVILSDCYNASLESFIAAFDTIFKIKNCSWRSAVIGDINELGDMSDSIHYRLGEILAGCKFRRIYVIGDMQKSIIRGYNSAAGDKKKIVAFEKGASISDVAERISDDAVSGEIILFKASRKMRFELIIDEIIRRCEN